MGGLRFSPARAVPVVYYEEGEEEGCEEDWGEDDLESFEQLVLRLQIGSGEKLTLVSRDSSSAGSFGGVSGGEDSVVATSFWYELSLFLCLFLEEGGL